MRGAPGLTLVVLSAFAIGIGANAAVFSVVNATLLRSLPYDGADRLMMLWERNPRLQQGLENLPVAAPNYLDWEKRTEVFERIALFRRSSFNIVGDGPVERVEGALVSPDLFAVLGVRPLLGRPLLPGDDQAGKDDVIVISYGFWQSRFGGSPDVIGKRVVVDGTQANVVGVMPSAFGFPKEIESASPQTPGLWKPITLSDADRVNRFRHLYRVVGRLKRGRTVPQAAEEMSGISRRLADAFPDSNAGFDVFVVPLHRQMEGSIRTPLLILLGAAGFVLLIACTNVANLILGRLLERRREIAIRQALGVSRWRLLQHVLAESLLFGLSGGALGVLLAFGAVRLLVTMPLDIPRLDSVAVDLPVLGFCLVLSLLVAVLSGLVPGLLGSHTRIADLLREGPRGATASGWHATVRKVLVVAEVAISLVLTVGASLLIRSFARVIDVDPGFNPERVLTVQFDLPPTRYANESAQAMFARNVSERTSTLAGVESSGVVSHLPLGAAPTQANFSIEGVPVAPGLRVFADRISASGGFFEAAGIRLLRGRVFSDQDVHDAPRAVIVNNTLARRFFGDEDPVGKRLTFGDADQTSVWWSVVGVVADARYEALEAAPKPQIYVSAMQVPRNRLHLMVRTSGDPAALMATTREAIWTIDREIGLPQFRTMRDIVSDSVARRRFTVMLLTVFACLGLILAASGTYAVVSRGVTQRMDEFAVRLALGAAPGAIVRLVIAEVLLLVLVAFAIGIPAAFAIASLQSDMLYEVSPMDTGTLAVTAALLVVVTLSASVIPARRAASLDPTVALRRS
jgi:predicted permease